jgi:hypothetical protein
MLLFYVGDSTSHRPVPNDTGEAGPRLLDRANCSSQKMIVRSRRSFPGIEINPTKPLSSLDNIDRLPTNSF